MGRLRGPPSRSSRITAIEAATSGTRAVIEDAEKGLISIRADIARLNEPRRESVPRSHAPAAPPPRPVQPLSRLVPRGGVFLSWRTLGALIVLGVAAVCGADLLTLPATGPAKRPLARAVPEEAPDWSAAWQPSQASHADTPAARITTGSVQSGTGQDRPSSAGADAAPAGPRRTYHSRETPQGHVAKRVLATRPAEPAAPSSSSRAWTGTFFSK